MHTLVQLNKKGPFTHQYPKPMPLKDGQYAKIVKLGEREYIVRMISFIAGKLLTDIPKTPQLIRSVGKMLAELDRSLETIEF